MPGSVVICGSFDDLRSGQIRFLEEAAKLGNLTVWLWPDALIQKTLGHPPKFPERERLYLVRSIRFVTEVRLADHLADADSLPGEALGSKEVSWVVEPEVDTPEKRAFSARHNLRYLPLSRERLQGFPLSVELPPPSGRKKVIVTGCYDWLHSGHVRFFEEVSGLGDLFVVLGRDENIRLLKGAGHPLLPEEERRYVVGSVRFVKQALLGTGQGWLDAEPEIQRLRPDIYAVNEDGDKGGKREFCARHGIEYLVLKRQPAPGLARRSSTDLRGF